MMSPATRLLTLAVAPVVGAVTFLGVLCAPETAMAQPPAAGQVRLYKGAGPANTPAEVLTDMALQATSTDGPQAAMQAIREKAQAMGANAVVDVKVETVKVDVPLAMVSGLPLAVLGGLESLLTLDAEPLRKATSKAAQATVRRRVWVVRGVAVRVLGDHP